MTTFIWFTTKIYSEFAGFAKVPFKLTLRRPPELGCS